MVLKIDDDTHFICRACEKANPKEDWKRLEIVGAGPVGICPFCGSLIALGVANVIEEEPVPEPEPDEEPVPELIDEVKAEEKKAAAKRKKIAADAKAKRDAKAAEKAAK